MKLIHNERRILKLLVQNARLTDTAISEKLKISTQAVGKLRKKLENSGFIKRYVAQVDYTSLGINVFSVALFKLSSYGWQYYRNNNSLLKDLSSNLVMLLQPSQGSVSHIAVFAFRDLTELDRYFQVLNANFSKLIDIQGIWSFSSANILKKSFNSVFSKVLDEYSSVSLPLPSFSLPNKPLGIKDDCGKLVEKLTNNEATVLQWLLKNGRIADAAISRRTGLSTRAVGKIRIKLERIGLIRGYNTDLDFEKLSIGVFAVLMIKEKEAVWEKFSEEGIGGGVLNCDNITHCFQTPDCGVTKILFCAFRNLRECDIFVNQMQVNFNSFFEIKSIFIVPHTALLKYDFAELFLKVLGEFDQKPPVPSPDLSGLKKVYEELNGP